MLTQTALRFLWGPNSAFTSRATAAQLVVGAAAAGTLTGFLSDGGVRPHWRSGCHERAPSQGKTATACGMNVIASVAMAYPHHSAWKRVTL